MENPFELIFHRLGVIEEMLLTITSRPADSATTEPTADQLLTVTQAATLLDLTKSTVYGLVWERKIPHSKQGKRLYFSRNELLSWISEGKQKTAGELDETARKLVANRQTRRKRPEIAKLP
ncbi:helix-turn-helix domain-containing protein [Spirosoma oryzicola]|uniref:helix-turn-helix domain-containing protein n=1 Tax=Spirosoma oryzicola TaxID=2898794 RepID=UPI001E2F2366|nr:helix-turn-helix domain-containing protein [Spirosoma oryzicola]UHG92534.1 helix-turn-helix domain-containing protein [Spirosoma oryzicola]